MNEKEFAELSAGHALDALSPEDERAYTEALAAHPEWDELVVADAQVAGFLGEGAAEETPPPALRAHLLEQIASLPQGTDAAPAGTSNQVSASEAPASEPPAPGDSDTVPDHPPTDMVQTIQRRSWTRGLFALVASVVLLVGIGWGVGTVVEELRTPVSVQALDEIEAAPDAQSASGQFADGGEAVVHWSASVGKAVLTTDDAPQIDADRTFELWYVRDETPISAGTFEPGDEVTALLDGDMQAGDLIAVTVEAAGGSPDGVPTTAPIVAIPTDAGDL
ncbi:MULTISPECIES: anti-sigma factor domain-containing protein [unclassified Microbacterium]|uniref:anti-sigma factor n=1 Tax=unclassified Microbacterium TaxID=2609290 RepID=UPI003867AF72